MITDEQIDQLAQVLRRAYVNTMIGRNMHSGFTLIDWDKLSTTEKAPYIAQAVAAFRYFSVKGDASP